MSEKILEATDQDFDQKTSQGTVLVDFWATWCGPCRMQSEILKGLAEKLPEDAKIVKVNVDEASESAARFSVRSIPTIVLLKDGETIQQMVGVQDEKTLLQALE